MELERPVDINSKNYAFDVLAKFNSFRKNNKYCDFVIKAGDKDVSVHRCVVAASSKYFECMLNHDTTESREGAVEFKEADSESIIKCIDFMYTGKATVSEEKQGDLFHYAHMLQLHPLYNGIALFLEKDLNFESFSSTREIANMYDCSKLVEACNNFALNNFRELAKTDDFKKIDAEYFEFLLSSKSLKERDDIKCKALIMWINYDSIRAALLFDFMQHIDFSKVSTPYRRYLVENEPTVSRSLKCRNYMMRSMFATAKAMAADVSLDLSPGIMILDSASGRLKCLDIKTKKWRDMQEMHPRIIDVNCSVVSIDESIYVFTRKLTTFCLNYKEPNAEWKQLANRKGKARGNGVVAVVLNGMVYAAITGGYSDCIEKYDPNQNTWSFLPKRSVSLDGSAIVGAENRSLSSQSKHLFLLGGRLSNEDAASFGSSQSPHQSNHPFSNVAEEFNPTSSNWSRAPSLRQKRINASATAINGVIYLFGGWDDVGYLQNVEILFANANTWQSIALTNFTRQNFMSCSIDGLIYLVGNNRSNFQTIDEFDPIPASVKTVASLDNMSLSHFSSVAVVI